LLSGEGSLQLGSKALRSLDVVVEHLFERARLRGYGYKRFLELFISCRYYKHSNFFSLLCSDGEFLSLLHKLVDVLTSASDTLSLMERDIQVLSRRGYKPFLVDCLGLPEIYNIYNTVSSACRHISVTVRVYINSRALTVEFTSKHHAASMSSLAKLIGASLYQKSTDFYIHEELGKLQKLNNILAKAEAWLAPITENIANDAISFEKAFIFSDHGYDTFCTPEGECYLEHGPQSTLAKIAPLIIINCIKL
jgi:hypothetical protein